MFWCISCKSIFMEVNTFTTDIARPDFDLEEFVKRALDGQSFRQACLENMLHHPHIMVYYHCFYVLEQVSLRAPELLYDAWDELAALLNHPNSYHRDFGLALLANLTAVDRLERFPPLLEEYLSRLHDEKFMTAVHCMWGLEKVVKSQPELTSRVLEFLLAGDASWPYPARQLALLKADILVVLETARARLRDPRPIDDFILSARNCQSPKTRKKAAELIARLGLHEADAVQEAGSS